MSTSESGRDNFIDIRAFGFFNLFSAFMSLVDIGFVSINISFSVNIM